MNGLLNSLRAIAREDEVRMGNLPAELVPSLPPAARARIADLIIATQARGRAAEANAAPASGAPHDGAGQVVPLGRAASTRPGRRTFLLGGAAVTLAAAAAFILWLAPSRQGYVAEFGGAPFPAYAVAARGGIVELRGGTPNAVDQEEGTTTAPARLSASSELRITCRPARAVTEPVAARAFFVQGGGLSEEVHPELRVAETGAVELRVQGADLVAQRHRGPGSVRVVVGRPGAVRAIVPGEAVAPTNGPAARWLTVPVELVGTP